MSTQPMTDEELADLLDLLREVRAQSPFDTEVVVAESLAEEVRDLRAKLAEAKEPTFPLERQWKPGDRVEAVLHRSAYSRPDTRPGTVARIDRALHWHESLVVKFDDGEERAINPDVMRHIKEATDA